MLKLLRSPFIILLSLAALSVGLAIAFKDTGFSPPGPLIQDEHFLDYEVRIYKRDDETIVERICDRLPWQLSDFVERVIGRREWSGAEILKNGRRVFSTYGTAVWIADFGSNRVAGMDITGDGVPNIALSDQFGRLGGGSLWVFECGKKFRQIATVDSLGTYPELKDLDGDGIPEVIASDNAFYHFPLCYDGEPMPGVILRWHDGSYVAARDLMAKPAPSQQEFDAKAVQIRKTLESDDSWGAWDDLSTTALELMYSGHETLGWKFLNDALPESAEKEGFVSQFRGRLEESAYWPNLETQNSTNKLDQNQHEDVAVKKID